MHIENIQHLLWECDLMQHLWITSEKFVNYWKMCKSSCYETDWIFCPKLQTRWHIFKTNLFCTVSSSPLFACVFKTTEELGELKCSVMGSSPSRSSGRIFCSMVRFWYPFHPCVTTVVHKDPGRSAKKKMQRQVTANETRSTCVKSLMNFHPDVTDQAD